MAFLNSIRCWNHGVAAPAQKRLLVPSRRQTEQRAPRCCIAQLHTHLKSVAGCLLRVRHVVERRCVASARVVLLVAAVPFLQNSSGIAAVAGRRQVPLKKWHGWLFRYPAAGFQSLPRLLSACGFAAV